ncbi:MAG TPA: hypothetical protein VJ892_00470 [Candidatus Absconditabacterales bacterium]|nr:hypothetical protein [Candidatus Absconditabacterales bacterium]
MLIAADKPKGISSFDIIRALKRELGEKKIGHSGTLDPMATGLLLIGTDKDTKKLHELTGLDKSYITTIDFSKNSDTRDLDYREYFEEYNIIPLGRGIQGVQIHNKQIPAPTLKEIKSKLDSIIPYGELPLTPFSAKKKKGKKLYELARNGIQEIENKTMKVNGYEIIEYSFPNLKLRLNVGSGTYIRSIGYRLGQQFGTGGILTELRRISIGDYDLDKITLDKQGTFFIKKDGKDEGEIEFKYGEI